MRVSIFVKSLIVLILSSAWQFSSFQDTPSSDSYRVTISHPGSIEKSTPIDLRVIKDSNNMPSAYYAVVKSVYCYDEVCKIDPVTIYWNSIGEYLRYELPPDVYLEKYEGEAFVKTDYEKLDRILHDENSPFKDLKIDEITASYSRHVEEGIDAISGATIVDLDESSTIEGSSLTCYTLWHWANGSIKDKIQEITAKNLSSNQLLHLLNNSEAYQSFAIKQLTIRKAYTEKIIRQMMVYSSQASKVNLNEFVKYAEGAPADIYFNMIDELMPKANSMQRVSYLSSLRKTSYSIPNGYYTKLSSQLADYLNYQEVDLLISLIEDKNEINSEVLQNVFLLLDKEILVARRAYYFLINQQLNKEQSKQLNKFYKKNKDYL